MSIVKYGKYMMSITGVKKVIIASLPKIPISNLGSSIYHETTLLINEVEKNPSIDEICVNDEDYNSSAIKNVLSDRSYKHVRKCDSYSFYTRVE